MKNRNKKTIVIGILCCLVVFMSIGYALLSQTLNINGTTTATNTWAVLIESITPIANNTGARSTESLVKPDKVSASFKAEFQKPGDYMEYEIVVANRGSIDAVLKSVESSIEPSTDKELYTFDCTEAPQGQTLTAGTTTTFKIRVTYNSNANRIPTVDADFGLKLNYEQKSASEVVTPVKTCEDGEINLAGECFHVMYEDDMTYTLLAKYNLLVGNTVVVNENFQPQSITPIALTTEGYGLQSVDAKGAVFDNTTWTGTIAFATPDESRKSYESCTGDGCYYGYWTDLTSHALLETYGTSYPADVYDSNSKLYEHVENYESYLKGQGYNSVSARLMTYKEAEDFGCVDAASCTAAPSWVYSNSYWLGSADYYDYVWFVGSDGAFDAYYFNYEDFGCGVRPVITVLKSEI